MEMTSLIALSGTYALTVALAVAAGGLACLVAILTCALIRAERKRDKLLKTDVFMRILTPKPAIRAEEQKIKKSDEKARSDKNGEQKKSAGTPKRGKKNKKPKYVFVSDSAKNASAENNAQNENDGDGAKTNESPTGAGKEPAAGGEPVESVVPQNEEKGGDDNA